MKKKILWIFGISLALLLVIVNFICRHVHIKKADEVVSVISAKLSESGTKFTYKDIQYNSVLAWKVKGKIIDPVLLQEKYGYSERWTLEHITFESEFITKKTSVSLPNTWNTLITDAYGEHKYISTFNKAPIIHIKRKNYFINNSDSLLENKASEYILNEVDWMRYDSTGHKVMKINTNNNEEIIYTIDSSLIDFKNQLTEKSRDLDFAIKFNNVKYYPPSSEGESYVKLMSATGDNDYLLNGKFSMYFKDGIDIDLNNLLLKNIQPKYKLSIKDFKLSSHLYSLDMKGECVFVKNKILPYFDLKFGLKNFQDMLSHIVKLSNFIISESEAMKPLSLKLITDKQKEIILTLFNKISKKTSDDNVAEIDVRRLDDYSIKINQYSVDDISSMYDNLDNKEKEVDLISKQDTLAGDSF
jgi:hypothetical protein